MRPLCILAVTAALLAACGTAAPAPSATAAGDPHSGRGSREPATPMASHASVPAGGDGSIELIDELAFGGSGVSVAEALEVASTQPVLVTGIVLRDVDGGTWACDELDEAASPPDCAAPKLWVLNFPEDQPAFDPANAESTGAQTEDGVTWIEDHQLFGVVHPLR